MTTAPLATLLAAVGSDGSASGSITTLAVDATVDAGSGETGSSVLRGVAGDAGARLVDEGEDEALTIACALAHLELAANALGKAALDAGLLAIYVTDDRHE